MHFFMALPSDDDDDFSTEWEDEEMSSFGSRDDEFSYNSTYYRLDIVKIDLFSVYGIQRVDKTGGVEKLGSQLLKRRNDEKLQAFFAPKQTIEALLESGYSLIEEQRLIMETKLSKEYMKNIDN